MPLAILGREPTLGAILRRSASVIRRAAVVATAVTLGLTAYLPTQAQASQPAGKGGINTIKVWDHQQEVTSFGCPNTTTYGQVITATGKSLKKFTFEFINSSSGGSMDVRGEVYSWNGTMATGSALYESSPRTIAYNDSSFHAETWKTGGVKVTKGQQYVLFASIDKDFESCTNNYTLGWGSVSDSVYGGGTFVYQNNTGDETQWTMTPWNTFGIDLAFKAS